MKYSYSWFYDNTILPDQNSVTLTFSSAVLAHVEFYTCVVRNAAGAGTDSISNKNVVEINAYESDMLDFLRIEELNEIDNITKGEYSLLSHSFIIPLFLMQGLSQAHKQVSYIKYRNIAAYLVDCCVIMTPLQLLGMHEHIAS